MSSKRVVDLELYHANYSMTNCDMPNICASVNFSSRKKTLTLITEINGSIKSTENQAYGP